MVEKTVLVLGMLLLLAGGRLTAAEPAMDFDGEIAALLGDAESWKAGVFADLSWHMSCDDVRRFFPTLVCASGGGEYDFPRVAADSWLVSGYEFTFHNGKLEDAAIIFHSWGPQEERFAAALLRAAQCKWGELPASERRGRRFIWSNFDRDQVSLDRIDGRWELLCSMPRTDGAAAVPYEAALRDELERVLGGAETWSIPIVGPLRRDMSCREVERIHPGLSGCRPQAEWSRAAVALADSLVQRLELGFHRGLLCSVTVVLDRRLAPERFAEVSAELMQNKWGRPSDGEDGGLRFVIEGWGTVERRFRRDHWEIVVTLD